MINETRVIHGLRLVIIVVRLRLDTKKTIILPENHSPYLLKTNIHKKKRRRKNNTIVIPFTLMCSLILISLGSRLATNTTSISIIIYFLYPTPSGFDCVLSGKKNTRQSSATKGRRVSSACIFAVVQRSWNLSPAVQLSMQLNTCFTDLEKVKRIGNYFRGTITPAHVL